MRRLQHLHRQIHFTFWLILIDTVSTFLLFHWFSPFAHFFCSCFTVLLIMPIFPTNFFLLSHYKFFIICVFSYHTTCILNLMFGNRVVLASVFFSSFLFTPLHLWFSVCLFVCSFIDSYMHLCLPRSFQFVFVSASSIPMTHISIIPVVPHYKLGSFAYSDFRHNS